MNNAIGLPEKGLNEWNQAQKALAKGNNDLAWQRMQEALEKLTAHPLNPANDSNIVEGSLKWSNLCWILGKGFLQAIDFLETALIAVERIGDRRSRALIRLHLGRLYFTAGKRNEAMKFFSKGKDEVDDLGDEDIITQAAELVGLYYFVQGRFMDACPYLEQAAKAFELGEYEMASSHYSTILLALCYGYLGQINNALGTVDYHRRLALERSADALATTLQSILGVILAVIHKKQEARFHLEQALKEAESTGNVLAKLLAVSGISYIHYLNENWNELRKNMLKGLAEAEAVGLLMHYVSSPSFEVLFELHRRNLIPIPGYDFNKDVNRIIQEANIHLKGVVLRLRAVEALDRDEYREVIESDLQMSLDCLVESGDPFQLGKTRLEMAHLYLLDGDHDKARLLVQQAWDNFSGFTDVLFPDELRHLLAIQGAIPREKDSQEQFINMFLDIVQELVPSPDLDVILNRTVTATNRILGAERGGIFWIGNSKSQNSLELRASHNLSKTDLAADDFRPSHAIIMKAIRGKTPVVIRFDEEPSDNRIKAVLCVPFEVEGRIQGVLYHDNSLIDSCFDYFDETLLTRLAQSLAGHIGSLIDFSRHLESKASKKISLLGKITAHEIVTKHSEMLKILDHVDKIAPTDCNVLILGETGVGKELIAHRLHNMSHRMESPLIIVDPTTLPENLVESELFGHEKGAFTGAVNQKTGRIELAHQSTLFIDEIAEIPQSTQVKLLRVLQEKTFTRVGGNRTIKSEFRLVAATNRNLAEEVKAGRFRKDLFYRLNVVELDIPPLRERKDDLILLANYFIRRYAVKYHSPEIRLTPEDERLLMEYNWPGNVRELENVIERGVLLSFNGRLELCLPSDTNTASPNPFSDLPTLDEIQRRYINHVLKKTNGKIGGPSGAAEILGVKRTSLNSRIKKLGLR